MGSSSSKAAKAAAGAATRRQYPTRPPPTSLPSANPKTVETQAADAGPSVHPPVYAAAEKDQTVALDARDPDFDSSLRSIGPVQPNSTMSNTSTFRPSPSPAQSLAKRNQSSDQDDPSPPTGANIFPTPSQNPALQILRARDRIAAEAEEEFSSARKAQDTQRRYLDMGTIRHILSMRDRQRLSDAEIENQFGLRKGVVASLSAVSEAHVGKSGADDSGLYG